MIGNDRWATESIASKAGSESSKGKWMTSRGDSGQSRIVENLGTLPPTS
jgi:hypothetical protein